MTDTITVYRHGKFTTELQPEWWERESDRACDTETAAAEHPMAKYGEEFGPTISAWRVSEGRGFIVAMDEAATGFMVWIPTDADYLDFLTTRVSSFIGLTHQVPTISESLSRLANVLTSFARHGAGEHVNRVTGTSAIDERRDRETRERHAARAAP